MTRSPDLVFLGPSLPWEEAAEIHPEAVLLPPAAVGDVISAVQRFAPHAIALIDGAFLQTLATYHKELIDVMARGIWVLGSSSMGALRAAECSRYGMIGVGQVFEAYADGTIEDDDEVALSHLTQEFGFRPVTEAMVNIRATLAAAQAAGVIDAAERDTLVDLQKARWFMDRRPLASVQDARDHLSFDPPRERALRDFLSDHWVDLKAADARLALETLRDLPPGPIPEEDRPDLVVSSVYEALVERDLTVGSDSGLPVTRDQIWRHFALTDPRAPQVVHEAVLRSALVDLLMDSGVELTESDLAGARAALASDLGVPPEQLLHHASSLDMTQESMTRWIEEEAFIRKVSEWRQYKRRSTGLLDSCLRQLARMGEYDQVKRTAGLAESLAASSRHLETALGMTTALKLHSTISAHTLPLDPDELDRYLHDLRLGDRSELYERLAVLIAAHRELFDLPPIVFVPAADEIPVELDPQTSRGR